MCLESLVVPIAVAKNSSIRENAASKIGSFTMCCFKTLIPRQTTGTYCLQSGHF